jgi:DNA-directed RNA polymerase subunit beta'
MESKGFHSLRVSLASPDTIKSWSYGEVLKPETINYRRLRPEKDGLFCEAIFGPTKDWQCYCGKYKNVRYKGIICDKCGVEVTRASVRRERMGHIELAAPVAHVWYTRRVPSYLGLLLDVSRRNLDRVLYFAQYVVTHVDEDARQKALRRLDEEVLREEKRKADEINAKIAAVKGQRDRKLADLESRREAVKARFDEEVEAKIDPIIKEGQKLERSINERMDTTIRVPVVFSPTDALIADKGETIARKHLTLLTQTVRTKVGEIEAELKEKRDRRLETVKLDMDRIKAETEDEVVQLREQLDAEPEIRENFGDEREQLLSLKQMNFLGEAKYRELKQKWGQVFKADMGAEAFLEILRAMDLDRLAKELWHEVRTTKSKQKKKKATKRLKVVEALRRSNNRPEWMVLTILPVIPPDLRPMVQLDGGRFATSDLNDLYRRVINRNNRLKRLLELGAPDVIVRNEKRMLQEAVDSLIDNSQRGKMLSRRGRRELKSLSDMLKGKKGRFRRNLLGKRVDYSGRSVIVIGPKLKLHQCGLPKTMALELYRPFVIAKLVEYNYASNVKGAKRIIERERPEVWEVLEEVIKDRPVLLNRAPTLHRLGIQAFEPILVEGKAIQIHPLVCTAFNADFDGDQMAVHLPLSDKAVQEARTLMLSTHNLLKPADGEPVVGPSKDMVLGVYYLTVQQAGNKKGAGRLFGDLDEVELAYSLSQLNIHAPIRLYIPTYYNEKNERYADGKPRRRMIETTVGRAIFNNVLPEEMHFVNETLDKGSLQKLVGQCYQIVGSEVTTEVVDRIKNIGFQYATRSGTTIAVSDLTVPPEKQTIIEQTTGEVNEVERQFRRGLLTDKELEERTIDLWTKARDDVAKAVSAHLNPAGSLSMMAKSGATKGGFGPISQLAGMRGLMADPSGRIIPLPIRSNFRDGLTTLEYFISTHGARKGLADTALRTADAGYLTRRLVDVAQDVIVNGHDCGTEAGIFIRHSDDVAGQSLYDRILGRVAARQVVDPKTGELIVARNEIIDEAMARSIQALAPKDRTVAAKKDEIGEVYVRSVLTCGYQFGVCALCYGRDLGRGTLVEIGSAVGIVAAQSIGEPGTQLTLRTFHTGGVAAGGDITVGLPRVEELFEARKKPKGEAVVSEIAGTVEVHRAEKPGGPRFVKVIDSEMMRDTYEIPGNWSIKVEDGQTIADGEVLATRGESQIVATHGGKARRKEAQITVSWERRQEEEYEIPSSARLLVVEGQRVSAGDALTEGSLNPHRILRILGREASQLYLLTEVQKVYRSQGQNINDKHFEVIVKKMLSKVQIVRPGDTELLPGELIDRAALQQLNENLAAEGKATATAVPVLLGVTKASLSTDSFLSASSFQHTIKVLAGAAIEGKEDRLIGLKENVIIGKLIPAGTGFGVSVPLAVPTGAEGGLDLAAAAAPSLDEA